MKAIVCRAFGEPDSLTLEDVDHPALTPGTIKIGVHACGVNFPDVLLVQGKYQMKPPFPFSPGLEVAGDILEIGSDVEGFVVGQRVMGIVNYGGFAEEVVVPAEMVIPMPMNMSYEQGAVFPIVYGTSHVALSHRAKLKVGEVLLVLGAAGGVGLTAVEIGRLMGGSVIAAASTDEKLALTAQYGANYTINYTHDDLKEQVREITQGKYASVIYDPVGGDLFDTATRCIGWEGRYLVIGFASGRIPELPANRVLLKNSALIGTYWGAYAQAAPHILDDSFEKLLTWFTAGKIKPHIHKTYPLADAAAALNALINRDVRGKIALVI